MTTICCYSSDSEQQQRATGPSWKRVNEHEGLAAADIDGDGLLDILGKPYNHNTPDLNIWLNVSGTPRAGARARFFGRPAR